MSIIFIIISLACLAIGLTLLIYNASKKRSFRLTAKVGLTLVIVGFISVIYVPACFHQVSTGEVAVVKVWGEAKETKSAGIHFDDWISKEYVLYDTKTQQINENIEAYSFDGQSMTAQLVVQYRIQSNKVIDINTNYGSLEQLQQKISSVAIERCKVVLSNEGAMQIIEHRSTLSSRLEDALKDKIAPYYVDLTLIVATDITFSDAFETVVEQKMIAEQDKLKAQYEKDKAIIKAEEELEVAKKKAESTLAAAEGEANAMKAIAQAEADALNMKTIEAARMLGFTIKEKEVDGILVEYVDYEGKTADQIKLITDYLVKIEYYKTWDGKLPDVVVDDASSIIVQP